MMDRGLRRNVERQIRKLIRKSGDYCTICGAGFQHNTRTAGGLTAAGNVALTGECCADKVTQVLTSGLFVNRDYQEFLDRSDSNGRPSSSPEAIGNALNVIQSSFRARDTIATGIQRRAGIASSNMRLNFSESPWKADDAAWFAAHPHRSHRLRSLIAEEAKTIPPPFFESLPREHEVQMVVRQVEPGQRIRAPFGRNIAVPIPDDEEIVHAIFDMIFTKDRKQDVIGIREVAELANKYAASKSVGNSAN